MDHARGAGDRTRDSISINGFPMIVRDWSFGRTDLPYAVTSRRWANHSAAFEAEKRWSLPVVTVQVVDLRVWMGYQIEYLPFLPWMFVAAMLAIVGLTLHFASRVLPASAPVGFARRGGRLWSCRSRLNGNSSWFRWHCCSPRHSCSCGPGVRARRVSADRSNLCGCCHDSRGGNHRSLAS